MGIFLFLVFAGADLCAQLTTHPWPTGPGQATVSDKYEVYVALGAGPEQKLEVLMSNAIPEGDFAANELAGRTFSFVNLDYAATDGALRFRVVKKFGNASSAVDLAPRSYGLTPAVTQANEVTFTVDAHSRYLSVNFKGADNETSVRRWIKHMLCVFIDPPETDRPDRQGPGVATYSAGATTAELAGATTLYFPAGYHNLRAHTGGAPVADGILTLRSGQRVYLASGAFVEGLIATQSTNDRDQRLFGRGILTGRLFPWYEKPGYTGPRYQQLVRLGGPNTSIEGVTLLESPSHGIVAGNRTLIANLKFLGWHSNNDAVRVGSGSEIRDSFIRAVDDHFYNFDIWVHDCVLWAGHNGAILTYGWGGDNTESTYNSGSSLLENIDIIHPEWMGLGNNNSLVAAQTGFDYKPFGYGGPTLTVLRRIRIEGSIPGLINLKPRSASNGTVVAVKVAPNRLGYLGDLLLEDIQVDAQSARGRIKGGLDATTTGGATYYTQNVRFQNLRIGGQPVSDANAATYFEIEASTTRDITFAAAPPAPRSLTVTATAGAVTVTWTESASGATEYVVQRASAPDGPWATLPLVAAGRTSLTDTGLPGGTTYHYRVRAGNAAGASDWTASASVALPPQLVGPTRLANVSCRLRVEEGETVIPGFVLGGSGTSLVLVRAVGPSLSAFLSGAMPNPELELYENGARVAANDDWDPAAIGGTFAATGAFALERGSRDAALVASASPGRNYTVLVRGRAPPAGGSAAGIVLIEVYAIPGGPGAAALTNASIRAQSGAGERVLILGFVLDGPRQQPLLVRGIGPTLRTFGVANALGDPGIAVFDERSQSVVTDDNWSAAAGLARVFAATGAFPLPPSSPDAAVLVSLPRGAYTVQITDAGGSSGAALVELYLPPP